ncbi:MAG: alpha/beta hydrolase [Anaerolineales bacterium]|nr:alpha/beta hydrolase [Anaerolineales bacterium]
MPPFWKRYQQDRIITVENLQSGSQVYETEFGLVECACTGTGPAVLISHGGSGGYDMGVWLAGLLGGEYQYIAPSRFGYLRTPIPENSTPQNQADSFASLLDTLNITSAFIIGLSSGGPSALQFAHRHPGRCRGLIMLSAISRPIPPLPFILRMIFPFMLRSDFIPWGIYAISSDFVYRSNGVNRDVLARIKPDSEKMLLLERLFYTSFPTSLRRDGIINDMDQVASLQTYDMDRIVTPTLVIHAVDDPIVPIDLGEYTAQTIQGTQFLRINDGGHFCSVTHREEVVPTILGFLERFI